MHIVTALRLYIFLPSTWLRVCGRPFPSDASAVAFTPSYHSRHRPYGPCDLLRASFLHPSTVDRDKVVENNEGHGSDAEPVREVGEGGIGDHDYVKGCRSGGERLLDEGVAEVVWRLSISNVPLWDGTD